jgi:outer membrane protein assembly factor BamB
MRDVLDSTRMHRHSCHSMMLSRWLRWLVLAPFLLFVTGALMLSCGGSGSSSATPTPAPGFALEQIVLSNGLPPSPTITPSKTPKSTPTLTPRPSGTTTSVITPSAVPTTVGFDAIGTFKKNSNSHLQFQDLTTETGTVWLSSDPNVLMAPPSGPEGGAYTTGAAGCACVSATSSGRVSQQIGVGVLEDANDPAGGLNCTPGVPFLCAPPLATPTATASPGVRAAEAVSTPSAPARSAGVLMWTFDAGSEVRGRIATGADGSIFFITRDGVLHGLDSAGKEIMHRDAAGSSPAVLSDGTVVAMASNTSLGAIAPGGSTLWNLEIGKSEGPLAVSDSAIYAAAGVDLASVSTSGALNWRVGVGSVTTAATTADGIVVASSRGAVTALASDGAVLWTFQPEGGFAGSLAYADDVIYAGSGSGGVYAIDSRTGNPIWHVNRSHAVTAGPAVAPSGTIFAGTASEAIYGINPDGQIRWKDPTLKPGDAGLTVLGNDAVFEAATGDLGAVLMGNGSYVWTSRSFGKITTAASSASGMLYIGTLTGRIFAMR